LRDEEDAHDAERADAEEREYERAATQVSAASGHRFAPDEGEGSGGAAAQRAGSVGASAGAVSSSARAGDGVAAGDSDGNEDEGGGAGLGGSAMEAPPATRAAAGAAGKPIVCIMVGMAGSGKTTLMQRVNAETHMHSLPSYIMNLDPAVTHLPYGPNIDIRDTVNYKEVMRQYNLGPNGGIVTSLNLFATRFDQVMKLLEAREGGLKHVFIDTPGQIEVFTWSASGAIITDMLASSYPCVLVYVVDTPRCRSPVTFMSNMLYACSIMYKTRLPFVVAFNKVDAEPADFALEWMQDFEAFQVRGGA
jgi:GTPase SAR1 family protein